ncbi:MAG: hypothetical protein ACQEQ0_10545 [Bacteroidota bacterium]
MTGIGNQQLFDGGIRWKVDNGVEEKISGNAIITRPGRFQPVPESFFASREILICSRAPGTGQNFPGKRFFSREQDFFFRDAKFFPGSGFSSPGTQIFLLKSG